MINSEGHMDLFEELDKLVEMVGRFNMISESGNDGVLQNIADDSSLVAYWLSELLAIKRARIDAEVFMMNMSGEGSEWGDDFATCSECGREVDLREEGVPVIRQIPNVDDEPSCVCGPCFEKNPERFTEEVENLLRQMIDGEFSEDCSFELLCPRCNSRAPMTAENGILKCSNCGAHLRQGRG